MLDAGRAHLFDAPHLTVFPGPGDRAPGARLQFPGRWAAGPGRSEDGALRVISSTDSGWSRRHLSFYTASTAMARLSLRHDCHAAACLSNKSSRAHGAEIASSRRCRPSCTRARLRVNPAAASSLARLTPLVDRSDHRLQSRPDSRRRICPSCRSCVLPSGCRTRAPARGAAGVQDTSRCADAQRPGGRRSHPDVCLAARAVEASILPLPRPLTSPVGRFVPGECLFPSRIPDLSRGRRRVISACQQPREQEGRIAKRSSRHTGAPEHGGLCVPIHPPSALAPREARGRSGGD